jgi:hypothetical protein
MPKFTKIIFYREGSKVAKFSQGFFEKKDWLLHYCSKTQSRTSKAYPSMKRCGKFFFVPFVVKLFLPVSHH